MNDELQLKQIFVKNIDEKIDGVVKASDDGKIADEVREYVLTNEIQTNLEQFLDTYNDPTADYTNGVWISGFFGSGKSHLLKILSHILGDAPTQHSTDDNNREPITRTEVIDNMKAKALQAENHELEGLLDANLRIPAMSLLFNIDSISQKGSKTALMDAFIRVFDDARDITAPTSTSPNWNATSTTTVVSNSSRPSSNGWPTSPGPKAVHRPHSPAPK